MNHSVWLLLGGFLVSAGLMPLLIVTARRIGIVDNPTHRKIHSNPTPYLGGLGIVAGFTLVPALWIYFRNTHSADALRFIAIVLPALALSMLGLADDTRPVRAKYKLLVQFTAAFLFAYFGFRIELVEFPGFRLEGLWDWESIPITVLWMLVIINGVNLIDGVDGLAGSVTAVIYAAIALLAVNLPAADWLVATVALAALGATLGFLCFNWRPARIYMGDAGSLATGMLIATLLIALGQRQLGGTADATNGESVLKPYSYQFAKITLIAFYPIMEITLSVARRLLSGKPIGSADKGHVHHRLLRWGWTAPMICGAAALISATAAAIVIFTQLRYLGVASWLLLAGGIMFVLLMHSCGFLEMFHPKSIRGNRPHFLIANYFISMQRVKLELARNIGEIAALTEQTCIEFGVEKYAISLAPETSAGRAFQLDWNKPETAHGSILLAASPPTGIGLLASFSDKTVLPSGTHGTWTFEPHVVEEEIDVEYRVLMSEFMRKALGCAEYLYRQRPAEPGEQYGHPESSTSVRSSELRRRKSGSQRVQIAPRGNVPLPSPHSSGAHGE